MATTTRTFRCPDELWAPAMAKARREGRTLTDVLVEYLRWYAEETGCEPVSWGNVQMTVTCGMCRDEVQTSWVQHLRDVHGIPAFADAAGASVQAGR